jgi:hypothetical protein
MGKRGRQGCCWLMAEYRAFSLPLVRRLGFVLLRPLLERFSCHRSVAAMTVVVEAFIAGEMVQEFADPIPQATYRSFGRAA